jgi:hypothetical protein
MVKELKLLTQGQSLDLTTEGKESCEQISVAAAAATFVDDIQNRAETITPLLKELLDYRPPPHWGINE